MTISLVRVDDRLVHAQVVVGWIEYLRCSHILVVNDAVSRDPEQIDLLRMVVPEEIVLDAIDVPSSAKKWPELVSAADSYLILFSDPASLLRAIDLGMVPKEINLGGMHESPGRRQWLHGLFASDADIAAIRKMIGKGIDVEIRLVPSSRRREVEGDIG